MRHTELVDLTLNTLIDTIGEGTGDWRASWVGGGMPRNHITNKRYNGVNILQLWVEQQLHGYPTQEWGTYKQWASKKFQVSEGQKSAMIMIYKPTYKKDDHGNDTNEVSSVYFGCAPVFNAAQLDNPPETTTLPGTQMGGYAERMTGLAHLNGIQVLEGGGPPSYSPKHNHVLMPDVKQYFEQEGYAHDLAHEMAHATGHKTRLNRELITDKNTRSYAVEELVAELCGTFTCVDMGIPLDYLKDNTASYLQGWCKEAIKKRKEGGDMTLELLQAAKHASAAFDWLTTYRERTFEEGEAA